MMSGMVESWQKSYPAWGFVEALPLEVAWGPEYWLQASKEVVQAPRR